MFDMPTSVDYLANLKSGKNFDSWAFLLSTITPFLKSPDHLLKFDLDFDSKLFDASHFLEK